MSQILSQDEVDALLRGITDGDVETKQEESTGQQEFRQYDLTTQRKIIRGKMPSLEIINENFTRMFRKTLSSMLRRVVGINTLSVNFSKYDDFLRTLPLPSSLHIFKMDPLRGEMLFIVESKLIFTLVDFLFGGSGREGYKVEGRDFTPIENSIIKRVIVSTLSDLEKAWGSMLQVNVSYKRSEMNPQFAQIVSPSDVVVIVNFEIEMDYSSGVMSLCIPYSSLEPVRDKLQGGYQTDKLEADKEWISRLKETLKLSNVNVHVDLGKTELTGREIVSLKRGDVILLDQYYSDDLNVYLEKRLKYKGQPCVYRGSQAIKISEICKNEEGRCNGSESYK